MIQKKFILVIIALLSISFISQSTTVAKSAPKAPAVSVVKVVSINFNGNYTSDLKIKGEVVF
jgi:hypothetical protein